MKRILTIAVAALMCAVSCSKLGIPTVEFQNVVGKIYPGTATTPVEVKMNLAQETETIVNVKLAYIDENLSEIAVKDMNAAFGPGETKTTMDIPNTCPEAEADGKTVASIRATITGVPAGFVFGAKIICLLAISTEEAVVCSFESETADLIESLNVKVNLTGTVSGKDYKAKSNYTLPVIISGPGKDYFNCDGKISVAEGDSYGVMTITPSSEIHDVNAVASVKIAASDGIIEGDVTEELITVRGLPTAETLAGTWNFKEIINAEELELWYTEMEDDYSACPVHNDGFSLTIAEKDGKLSLTPSATGDFANYYRTSTMELTAPKNPVHNSVILGKYTAQELNGFFNGFYATFQQSIFYSLSNVNRSFDNTSEALGAGVISISFIDDDNIAVTIHDYDEPPFAIMWWDSKDFDPEMIGFASVFTRAK